MAYAPYMGGFSGRPGTATNPRELLGASGFEARPTLRPFAPAFGGLGVGMPTSYSAPVMNPTPMPQMPAFVGPGQTPLTAMYGPVGTGQGYLLGPNHLATLGQALQGDVLTEQAYADEQFGRLGGVANQFAEGLQRGGREFRALGGESASRIEGLGKEDRDFFEKKAAEDRALFKDLTAQKAQALTDGLRSDFEDRKVEIQNGLNPDGSVMTPQQKRAALNMLERDVKQQVANTAAQIGSNYNEQVRNAATVEMGQRVDSMAQRQALQGMAENIRSAGLAAALNLEVLGLQGLADMIRQNPRTHVSRYAALAEMFKNNMTQFNANTAVNMQARSARGQNREAGRNVGFKNFPRQGARPKTK